MASERAAQASARAPPSSRAASALDNPVLLQAPTGGARSKPSQKGRQKNKQQQQQQQQGGGGGEAHGRRRAADEDD